MLNQHSNPRVLTYGIAIAIGIACSALTGETGWAQKPNDPNQDMSKFKISGTIKAMVPGYLQVETGEKEVWVIQVRPVQRSVRFIGSAAPDWLMPGLWVNFTTRFNAKGQAVDPVKLLTIFTPGAARGKGLEPYRPGLKSLVNPGAGISFSGEGKAKPKTDAVPFEVTGQLKSINKSGLTLVAGNYPLQVSLTEEASISVDLADLSPSRVGDKVEVSGRAVAPLKGIATRVEVRGANPLSSKPMAAPASDKQTETESKPGTETTQTPATPDSGEKKLPLLGQKPAAE